MRARFKNEFERRLAKEARKHCEKLKEFPDSIMDEYLTVTR